MGEADRQLLLSCTEQTCKAAEAEASKWEKGAFDSVHCAEDLSNLKADNEQLYIMTRINIACLCCHSPTVDSLYAHDCMPVNNEVTLYEPCHEKCPSF